MRRSNQTIWIHDFGSAGENSFYNAMDYLSGIDLRRIAGRYGPLSPAPPPHGRWGFQLRLALPYYRYGRYCEDQSVAGHPTG